MENKEIKLTTIAEDVLEIESTLEKNILSEQIILNDLANGSTKYLVCYINNMPVGYLAYSNCIDHIDIISIAVKPIFRHKGIAKSLFYYMENSNSTSLPLFLEVRESNTTAIKLYTSLGFKNIYIRKNYYKNPTENALIYSKE